MLSTFWLTEEQFGKVSPLLPNKVRGVARVDDRCVLSGIIYSIAPIHVLSRDAIVAG